MTVPLNHSFSSAGMENRTTAAVWGNVIDVVEKVDQMKKFGWKLTGSLQPVDVLGSVVLATMERPPSTD